MTALAPSTIIFEPYEEIYIYNAAGEQIAGGSGDIGTDSATFAWHPPSSQYASTSGSFYDVPVGVCTNYTYAAYRWSDQDVSVVVGEMEYPVYSNSWTASGTGDDHGTLTNGSTVVISN